MDIPVLVSLYFSSPRELTEVYLSGSSIPEPSLDNEILGLELGNILHEPFRGA